MQDGTLAVRILTALGRIHIVIFHDPQPAVLLDNASSQDMEVGTCIDFAFSLLKDIWLHQAPLSLPLPINKIFTAASHPQVCLESSEQSPDGAMTFTAIGQITRVTSRSEAELFLSSSQALQSAEDVLEGAEQQGAWQNDAEEEEAFLEAVTRQQQSQHPSELLLKCRWTGASDWACWYVLREGASCTTGISRS